MARHVFFSYHFQNDAWRANQVRHSWVAQPSRAAAGFFDHADQEGVKRESEEAVKRWIDSQLHGTSVTAVLIGEETAERDYVQYEIEKSFERGNALVGIRIHNLKNREGNKGVDGRNPLKDYSFETDFGQKYLSEVYPTYDWYRDNGRENTGDWVEGAVEANNVVSEKARESLKRTEPSLLDRAVQGAVVIVGAKLAVEGIKGLSRNFK